MLFVIIWGLVSLNSTELSVSNRVYYTKFFREFECGEWVFASLKLAYHFLNAT